MKKLKPEDIKKGDKFIAIMRRCKNGESESLSGPNTKQGLGIEKAGQEFGPFVCDLSLKGVVETDDRLFRESMFDYRLL